MASRTPVIRSEIETRGTESIARRDKARLNRLVDSSLSTKHAKSKGLMRGLVIVGSVFGATSLAEDAIAAGDVLTESRAIKNAKQAAERGDVVGVTGRIVVVFLAELRR